VQETILLVDDELDEEKGPPALAHFAGQAHRNRTVQVDRTGNVMSGYVVRGSHFLFVLSTHKKSSHRTDTSRQQQNVTRKYD